MSSLLRVLTAGYGRRVRSPRRTNRPLLEVERTYRESLRRLNPTRMTHCGHQLGGNPALQRAPDLILSNPLCCDPG